MENDIQKINLTCPSCGQREHSFFTEKDGFCIYRCGGCDMLQVHPLPPSTSQIYGMDYFSGAESGHGYVDYDADKEPMRNVFEKYLKKLEKISGKKGRLLDVGAASGFFMIIARDKGFAVKGVELSAFATSLARKKGLDVFPGSLEQASFPKRSFDVVTLCDVLEHFPDPNSEIQRTSELLVPGGLLLINTPDAGSWYARMLRQNWHLIVPPEHLYYFNRKSVRLLLEKHGFSVIEMTTIGKSFTLEYVALTLSKRYGVSFLRRIVSFLSRYPRLGHVSLPINLRDNMFVIARKNTS